MKTSLLMIVLALALMPLTIHAQGDALPLAEEGSPEAERLRQAHEADLQGAMESPEEAAEHQKHLDRERGVTTPTQPAAPSEPAAPPPASEPSSSLGAPPSDLAVDSEPEWLKQGGDPNNPPSKAARPAPPPPSAAPPPPTVASNGVANGDLAVDSEPEWLKQGGDPNNPPTHRKGASAGPAAPAASVPSVDVQVVTKNTIFTPPLRFGPWSTDLGSRDQSILMKVAEVMKQNPQSTPKVVIEAYSDNSGDPAVNEALTIARANVVKAYLIAQGVGVHRLEAKGMGDANPIASNDTAAGRAQNRRIEFRVEK